MTSEPFADSVLASLRRQRSLTSPFCDVVLKCGDMTIATHGSILAAVSRYFENVLVMRKEDGNAIINQKKCLDMSAIFLGVESMFPEVIDSLYLGKFLMSYQQNHQLKTVYDILELKLTFLDQPKETGSKPSQSTLFRGSQAFGKKASPQKASGSLRSKSSIEKEASLNAATVCPKCDTLFMSKEEFLTHKTSQCIRRLTCRTCSLTFVKVQKLVSHLIEARHNDTTDCSACGFNAPSQEDYDAHLVKHQEVVEKPYFCAHCDLRFSTRKKWAQHLPKHSSFAPFVCSSCGKAFKWKHALTAHEVVHSTEKKFLCQECGFSTSHVSTFRFHSRMHTGYMMSCQVHNCTFQTTRKSNLNLHQLTHSKEKPHQCEVCGRSFSLAKNMRRHARQHDTSATAFKCKEPDCTFSSLRSDKFYEHVKKYHTPQQPPPPPLILRPVPAITSTTTLTPIASYTLPTTSKTFRIEKRTPNPVSPFNVVNPPNKSVIDALHGTFTDDSQVPIEEPVDDLAQGKIIVVDEPFEML